MNQKDLTKDKLKEYQFLKEMYGDPYFPNFVVDKGKDILVELCFQIEKQKPQDLEALYKLTHAATDRFNDLQDDFAEHDSEIETAARECIAMDFEYIAEAYGFDADVEELIETRDW